MRRMFGVGVVLLLALAACAPTAERQPAPFTLSYPDASADFPGHRRLAEPGAPAYVRVTIYDQGDGIGPAAISAVSVRPPAYPMTR